MTDTNTAPEPGSYGSHRLDVLLRNWRDTSIPSGTEEFLSEEHAETPEANAAIVAAELGAYVALADLIDAFRAHPDFAYEDGLDRIRIMLDELPSPPAPMATPTELILTRAEAAALASGNGDRPVGARA